MNLMITVQLIVYLLVFTMMVKIAVKGNALNGIYFYPKEVQKRAIELSYHGLDLVNPRLRSKTQTDGKTLQELFVIAIRTVRVYDISG